LTNAGGSGGATAAAAGSSTLPSPVHLSSPHLSLRSQFKTKPTFLVLTSDSLLLYEKIPQSEEDWLQPTFNYPLLTTRLVTQTSSFASSAVTFGSTGGNSNNNNNNNASNNDIYFNTSGIRTDSDSGSGSLTFLTR
jgi:hypothetical protein